MRGAPGLTGGDAAVTVAGRARGRFRVHGGLRGSPSVSARLDGGLCCKGSLQPGRSFLGACSAEVVSAVSGGVSGRPFLGRRPVLRWGVPPKRKVLGFPSHTASRLAAYSVALGLLVPLGDLRRSW